jgi:hypothetical protein
VLLRSQPELPVYSRDIAPIVRQNCVSCHRPGESAPFSLLTFEDVRKHGRQIAAVTASRFMPPWLPQPGYGDFSDERRLSGAQIAEIAAWVKGGMPEGEPEANPPAAASVATATSNDEWQLGKPDLVLTAAKPFTLAADGPDVFWNFIFTP